jgi:hypothetical protein
VLPETGPNRGQCLQAIHFKHLQVHQGDVRAVRPELLNRVSSIRGFRHQAHVQLSSQEGGYPLPE